MKSFKISAVIPTYNSIKTVERTIRSLLDQSLKLSEIIVVDNASTDHSSTILNKKFGSNLCKQNRRPMEKGTNSPTILCIERKRNRSSLYWGTFDEQRKRCL